MANTKSTALTNQEASGSGTWNDPRHMDAPLMLRSASIAWASSDGAAHEYRYFRVRSSDSVKAIWVINDPITGGSNVDVGLYHINEGAVVNATSKSVFSDGISLVARHPANPPIVGDVGTTVSTNMTGYECRFGERLTSTSTSDPSTVNWAVWEILNLSSDPQVEYDLVVTCLSDPASAGDVAVIMHYTASR